MESVNNDLKKKIQKIDRVVLDAESIAAVQALQQEVNDKLGDLVQISLKDIVNFVLRKRIFSLKEDELNELKSEHFDLVKALRKATSEVIKAKQNGFEFQLDEVLKIIQTPGVSQSLSSKKVRGRKTKVSIHPTLNTKLDINSDEAPGDKPSKNDQ